MMLTMERIRQAFETECFTVAGVEFQGTVSFRIPGFAGSMTPQLEELMNLADQALYSAKNNGRNRIEFCEE